MVFSTQILNKSIAPLIIIVLIILAGMYSRISNNKILQEGLSIMPEMCAFVLGWILLNLMLSEQLITFENYYLEVKEFSWMQLAFLFVFTNYFKVQRESKDSK